MNSQPFAMNSQSSQSPSSQFPSSGSLKRKLATEGQEVSEEGQESQEGQSKEGQEDPDQDEIRSNKSKDDDDKSTNDSDKSKDESELEIDGKQPILIVNDNKTDLEKEEENRGNDLESDMSMDVKIERASPDDSSPKFSRQSSQESLGLSSFHDSKFIYHN